MKKLTIIIPVYNEEKTVEKLLHKVLSTPLPVKQIEYIVVDDGSTDGSAAIIAKFKKSHPTFLFIQHKKNSGKGAAVRTGIEQATGEYIVIQDADLEYNPQEITKLLQPVEDGKAKVVYGTRLKRLPNFSRDERTMRFLFHYLGNKFLSLLTSILYFHWVTDMETCYKLFPKKALEGVTLDAKGFEFEPEITAKLLKQGYSIFEVPISTNPRTLDEGKKLDTFRDGRKALWTLVKYRFIPFDKKFSLAVLAIMIVAVLLRVINYHNRFILGYDQAHDALLSRFAIASHQLPLLGPFSSAGPFQTGGEWYWLIMFGMMLFPFSLVSPWIFMTFLYILFVYLIILLGKEIGGKKFAVIVGTFAAISTVQIQYATNLTNQTPQAFISLIAIWCAVRYLKNVSGAAIFLLGLCIGIASSIHLSGVALLCLALSLFLVKRKINIAQFSLFVLGGIIPWVPVFVIDFQNNFINTRHMLQYYLHDQYKIPLEALGRRWKTYIGVFWPLQWANIIGGFPFLGYIEILSIVIVFIYRKYLTKVVIMLLLSVAFMVTILRYTHTPLFDSYLIFMHPFILLLTAWGVYLFLEKKKIVGITLFTLILLCTLYQDYTIIKSAVNENAILVESELQAVHTTYPNKKFAVYTYKDKWNEKNYVLSLYLTSQHISDPNGIKLSTIVATQAGEFINPVLYGNLKGYQLISVNSLSSSILTSQGWRLVDGKGIYQDTEEWFKKSK